MKALGLLKKKRAGSAAPCARSYIAGRLHSYTTCVFGRDHVQFPSLVIRTRSRTVSERTVTERRSFAYFFHPLHSREELGKLILSCTVREYSLSDE
jgi:hypothetical protein